MKKAASLLMLIFILSACADTIYLGNLSSGPKEVITEKPLDWSCVFPIFVIILVPILYLTVVRPQLKKDAEEEEK